MEIKSKVIKLPEGMSHANLLEFDESDRPILFDLYKQWIDLSEKLTQIYGRRINLPEGLSEGAFALEMNCPRLINNIPGANSSFDCYDIINSKRIQVKACSVLPDLTSFGPKSKWDELYFCDFYRDGEWDGKFDIYLIENELIYSMEVSAGMTVRDQQAQGRRPRFSIYNQIIKPYGLKPMKTCNLAE
jgi:hypothetical protein